MHETHLSAGLTRIVTAQNASQITLAAASLRSRKKARTFDALDSAKLFDLRFSNTALARLTLVLTMNYELRLMFGREPGSVQCGHWNAKA